MKNAIIYAIVALLGFGSEVRAVRSIGDLLVLNDSISPDESVGALVKRENTIHSAKENSIVYNLKDTLDLWKQSLLSIYFCTTIFEGYNTWSACAGEYR